AAVQRAQVVLARAVQRADATDAARGRRRAVQRLLDLVLGLVGELEAVGAEELDPVVLLGVVRGAEDGGHVEAVGAQQERRGGGGQHAAEQRLAAGGGDARGDRGLEHLARLARVADDQHARALDAPLARAGRRRAGERER